MGTENNPNPRPQSPSAPSGPGKIMLSRAFSEVEEYRAALIEIIGQFGFEASTLGHYELTASGAIEASLELVRNSEALAIFIGDKYGPIPGDASSNPEQQSLAELEFNEALRSRKPVIAFATTESSSSADAQWERNERFRKRVMATILVYFIADLESFRMQAMQSISRLADRLRSNASETDRPQTKTVRSGGPIKDSNFLSARSNAAHASDFPDRPLVFISASHKDNEWRQLFREALDKYRATVQWWDDSQIEPGHHWEPAIEMALERARVALILLSPDYLGSQSAITEMTRLQMLSGSGRLRLFPIVVRDCDWQSVPQITRVQIWENGTALEHLTGRALQDELDRIAHHIASAIDETTVPETKSAAEAPPPDSAPQPQFNFSPGAQRVMTTAQELADRSNRHAITSSCLLFAFAETASARGSDSSYFVWNLLYKTGHYSEALQRFLTDASPAPEILVIERFGDTSRVEDVLEYAQQIVSKLSPDDDTIHQRHLLAALLAFPESKGHLNAINRLGAMGISRSRCLDELREFIRKTNPDDNSGEWARILKVSSQADAKTVGRFIEGPAGYTAEFCGLGGQKPVVDYLFVGAHADRLAELIALRETKLPLAIGLFGNWGSGKSHFMNLIDRRLKTLMEIEKQRPKDAQPKWCREIVPIYFNAWHYLDANLWASLVTQIFESLFAHLSPRGNDLEKVQQLLEEASGAAARAAEELTVAEKATIKAETELNTAKDSALAAQTTVNGLLRGLQKLLPEVTPAEVENQAAKLLGIEKRVETIDDLRRVVAEADSLAARINGVFIRLWKQPGRSSRLAWLTVIVLGSAIATYFATAYLPAVKDWLQPAGRSVATILGALSGLIVWLTPLLAAAGKRLQRLEVWASEAEAEQRRLRETPEVKEAELNRDAAIANETAARLQFSEAKARENQLKEQAKNLSPARKFGRYIEQRANSADYRGQLGLVSLARRDFEELSNLFADAEALREKILKLRASDDPENTKKADQLQELSSSIDRIVLFVDDLDRCQPRKIVEILQAVHLLLAFPLFAVVVGVDQRALRQSLSQQFRGLLTQDASSTERLATPLDYLEKIFHVPFHLPALSKDGFAELISKLTEASQTASEQNAEQPVPELPKEEEPPTHVANIDVEPPKIVSPFAGPVSPDLLPAVVINAVPVEHRAPVAVPVELVGSVPLLDWERKALVEYYSLIQTPRGAKRLLNTYRLVRAAVPKEDWDDFSRSEYRIAMLLLAAAAGSPATVREWFRELLKNGGTAPLTAAENSGVEPPSWEKFKVIYRESFANSKDEPTHEVITKWIQRVETFTF